MLGFKYITTVTSRRLKFLLTKEKQNKTITGYTIKIKETVRDMVIESGKHSPPKQEDMSLDTHS